MSTVRAYLGEAGLTDVGFRFYTQNTPEGARVTAGIVDEGDGWYSAAGIALVGDHVRWDSTGTASAAAREDLAIRLAIATLPLAPSTAEIWASAERTLTVTSDPAGVTTLLARIASALTITAGKIDVNDKTGFGLSSDERESLATVVEAHLLNEGDSQLLVNAIVAAIGNSNVDQVVLIAAIRADIERAGGSLKLTEAAATSVDGKLTTLRAGKLDRDISEKSDIPDDYQQRAVAVTLPNPAPDGYGETEGDTSGVTTLLGRLTAPRAALIDKLDVGEPDEPVIVIPGVPLDESLCRVFGYFEDLNNIALSGVAITFTLSYSGPIKSERLIAGRQITAKIVNGVLTYGDNSWLELQRNDKLTPSGSTYILNCYELGFKDKAITLADDLFDLASVVT